MGNFEKIWGQFDYIVDEMRLGMLGFEGLIWSVPDKELAPALTWLCENPVDAEFEGPIWVAEVSSEDEQEKSHTMHEYVELLKSEKVCQLALAYRTQDDLTLDLRLLIENWEKKIVINIICYRDAILGSDDPKLAIKSAIHEFRKLDELFKGEALFLGPDTSTYPDSAEKYPQEWIKLR